MRAFWDRGYSATSITDLTRATGLHPGGLYNEFGDKRGLFVAALRRYSERGLTRIAQLLTEAPSPIQGIRTYLLAQVELSWSPDGSRGCLMANTTLEILPGDPDLQDIVRRNFADIHTCIAGSVAAAQQVGEVTDRWSADAIASQLLTLVEGLFVLGRSAKDPEALLDVVDLTLDSLRPATEQIGQGRR
jgi:TetR/AcrR family transcriptional repressor of nem operon